jgi:peptidoglycan/xylan/chitin deacetylase (PgdA/CDA1 family)
MLERLLKKVIQGIASVIPLSIYTSMIPRDVLGIFYHIVSDEPLPHIRHIYPYVPVGVFKEALRYLLQHYNFIRYQDLLDHITKGNELPHRALHLSFDDGYQECYSVVRSILLDFDIPCTFFITTNFIDDSQMFYRNVVSLCIEHFMHRSPHEKDMMLGELNRVFDIALPDDESFVGWIKGLRLEHEDILERTYQILGFDLELVQQNRNFYMSTEELRKLSDDGFTIGAHTMTHRKLSLLPDKEIFREIVDSCRIIQDITGQDYIPFSFPHSAWGVDRTLLEELRDQNSFIGLFFDTKGLHQDKRFIVNRIWAERPIGTHSELQTIQQTLHAAYQEQWIDMVIAAARKLTDRKSLQSSY